MKQLSRLLFPVIGLLAAAPALAGTVTLTWTPARPATAFTEYVIYARPAKPPPYVKIATVPKGSTPDAPVTYVLTEPEGQAYCYIVRAVHNGVESIPTNEACPEPAVPTPTELR